MHGSLFIRAALIVIRSIFPIAILPIRWLLDATCSLSLGTPICTCQLSSIKLVYPDACPLPITAALACTFPKMERRFPLTCHCIDGIVPRVYWECPPSGALRPIPLALRLHPVHSLFAHSFHSCARKSCICHSYENTRGYPLPRSTAASFTRSAKSFKTNTYKMPTRKSFRMNTYKKSRVASPGRSDQGSPLVTNFSTTRFLLVRTPPTRLRFALSFNCKLSTVN
jgi:hypothetical protein